MEEPASGRDRSVELESLGHGLGAAEGPNDDANGTAAIARVSSPANKYASKPLLDLAQPLRCSSRPLGR